MENIRLYFDEKNTLEDLLDNYLIECYKERENIE